MKPIAERFWAKVDRRSHDECWPWQGHRHHTGMGQMGRGRRQDGVVYVSHVSWALHFGEIPPGKRVLHRCDNPACVNPWHLFLGTPRDNTADMLTKRRHIYGEQHPSAKLTAESARAIRASPESDRVLAKRYGVSRRAIYKIQNGLMWKLA